VFGAAARLRGFRSGGIHSGAPQDPQHNDVLRSILASRTEEELQKGDTLAKQVKIYPLSKAANPPPQQLLDMTRDLEMIGMLLPLGIEKGKEFKPDAATVALLKSSAVEA
jgi:hypothetical protein